MNAFSAAIDAIFADPNMAVDAVWRACHVAVGTPCRVIVARPDVPGSFGEAQIVSETLRIDVRVSQVASPRRGDVVTIGTEVFVVQGEPRRDRRRLVWQCEAVPQ
jgi:hypothetical protein